MSAAVDQTITIVTGREISDEALGEVIQLFDEAGLDVVVEPAPRRMGPAADLIGMIISAPLEGLVGALAGVVGRKLWTAIAATIKKRRASGATAEDEPVMLTLFDSTAHIRVDLTASDLSDDRLSVELGQLQNAKAVVVRWDRALGSWVVLPPDSDDEAER